jgi:2-polyprenyl-3-methyl-5-hydroxy-6-metoxy-1,4-benzoquinol methylase
VYFFKQHFHRCCWSILRGVNPAPSTFLEIGCGTGESLAYFSQAFQIEKALGIDLAEEAVRLARERYGNDRRLSFQAGDFAQLSARWPLIICMDVLEHLEKDEEALVKIKELLETNGLLFLFVPGGPMRSDDAVFGHFRRYTRSQIRGVLQASGFEILRIDAYGYPLLHWARMLFTRSVRSTLSSAELMQNTLKSSYAHPYLENPLIRVFHPLMNGMCGRVLELPLEVQRWFPCRGEVALGWICLAKPHRGF